MENQAEKKTVPFRISWDVLEPRILLLLYKHKELSLDDLSKEFGAEISDLTPTLNLLEKKGFIQKRNMTEANEENKISLREGKNCIIGLDLGGTKLYGAISDIFGNIVYELEIKNHGKSGEACFDMLANLIDRLIDESNQRDLNLLGIGVDVPGRVQLETGFVLNAPAVNMKDFPLKERLVSKFGYPTYIDNDLKQASLGEAWFGAGKNYRHVVLLAIGTGIAAGTVIDGNPLRGAHQRHGELGCLSGHKTF